MAVVRQKLGRPRGQREFGGGQAFRIASHVLNSLAGPFVILPTQIERRESVDSGEVKLLRCILLSAIADIVAVAEASTVARERRVNAASAWRWISGDPGAPIDFEMACAAVGMSAETMRHHVAALARRPQSVATPVPGTTPERSSSADGIGRPDSACQPH